MQEKEVTAEETVIFPAHIKVLENGFKKIQSVEEHCTKTALYAQDCLSSIGLGPAAKLAGLLHDMGKCSAASKQYQEDAANGRSIKRGLVIHTFQCCRYLLEAHHNNPGELEASDLTREILAYAASAHHGLYDCYNERKESGFIHRVTSDKTDYEDVKSNYFNNCFCFEDIERQIQEADAGLLPVYSKLEALSEQNNDEDGSEFSFYLGLLARLLLSSVIEGDRRDTAEFMNDAVFKDWPKDMKPVWNKRLQFAETKINAFPCDSPIQAARRGISEQCRAAADWPASIYRLNVPTGAGKTLSALRFALAHAEKTNKRRIIFTAPLLSILDQNASILREYIGDDGMILEHHSNVIQSADSKEQLDQNELLMENWNAPVIITTMVQLLNTLFDGRTSAIRRFWALCDSIVVIDEVQTVPNQMLTLFNLALNFLSEICGTTVVLCSATQPCLEHADHPLLRTPKELVPHDPQLWAAFARTNIIHVEDRRLEDIPAFILETADDAESLLVVCNKKSEAEYLFRQVSAAHQPCFHLSASMCMAHRRNELERLALALEMSRSGGPNPICISTQVIEAGVDISFGRVIRLTAGIDSIIQSAGRCNRNGESPEPAPVYVLSCVDEQLGMLRDIQMEKTATMELFTAFARAPERFDQSMASDKAVSFYYRKLYMEMAEEFQDYSIKNRPTLYSMLSGNTRYANPDSEGFGTYCLNQAFHTAGALFQVFNDQTETVVVPYQEGAVLIVELTAKGDSADPAFLSDWLERVKPYTVSIYDYQKKKLLNGGLYEKHGILMLQESNYDDDVGLVLESGKHDYWEV